ncbi:unnamed protein product, partial [Linum tenue]
DRSNPFSSPLFSLDLIPRRSKTEQTLILSSIDLLSFSFSRFSTPFDRPSSSPFLSGNVEEKGRKERGRRRQEATVIYAGVEDNGGGKRYEVIFGLHVGFEGFIWLFRFLIVFLCLCFGFPIRARERANPDLRKREGERRRLVPCRRREQTKKQRRWIRLWKCESLGFLFFPVCLFREREGGEEERREWFLQSFRCLVF